MISSGLFILPAIVYLMAGPSIIIAYILAAVLVVPAMLSKAELATAMPKSGGIYFFIQRSLGPLFGTFAGFASWFSLSLKSAFALVGIGIFLELIIPAFSPDMVKIIAVAVTLIFTVLNILSVKQSGKIQVVLVCSLITVLVLYIALSLNHIDVQHYVPFMPAGWLSVFTATGMIFISFGGLTKVAAVAEEVREPGKSIPRGMFAAFTVVTLLYFLTAFATVGVLNKHAFLETLTPISTGAGVFAGSIGFAVLSAAAMLAFITTANAGLMAASRSPLAMAKDNLLPQFFARVHVRLKTPVVSILTTSLFMILVILGLNLETLVKVASTMKLVLFAFVNVSVILMRESKIVSYKPAFKAPLYPYLQIAGIIAYIALVVEMGAIPLIITGAFFLVSLLWYLLYSRSRNRRESALIHIVERVVAAPIRSGHLSDELRDILMERDEIVADRFDRIIANAEILDVEGPLDLDGLFDLLSEAFAAKLDLPAGDVRKLLKERELESTTSIHPGLAIPHIVIEGRSQFEIAIVRSKSGIDYGEDIAPVRIVFALAGSQDERNFHLQALMAIAQIVQNPDFENHWLKVHDQAELRNLILVAERVRKGKDPSA